MNWRDIPFRPPPATLRRFGLIGCVVFAGLGGWQLYQDRWLPGTCLLGLSVALGTIALLRPGALRPVFVGMMIVTFPLSWLMSRLLLALVFYGVFTPLGLLFRLMGRDTLARRRRSDAETYWTSKAQAENVRSYFRQS